MNYDMITSANHSILKKIKNFLLFDWHSLLVPSILSMPTGTFNNISQTETTSKDDLDGGAAGELISLFELCTIQKEKNLSPSLI